MDVLYSSTFEWTEGQTALRWRGAVSGQILGRLRGGDEVWVRVFAVEERGSARWFAEGEEEEGRREVLDFLDLRTTGLPEIVGVWARVGVDWEVLGMEGKDGGERMVLRRFGMRVARRGRGSDAGMLEGGDRKGRKRQGKVDGDGGERELGQEEVLELRIWEEMGESIARHVWYVCVSIAKFHNIHPLSRDFYRRSSHPISLPQIAFSSSLLSPNTDRVLCLLGMPPSPFLPTSRL